MVTGLSIHLRPMVRKGKSLLFGHISRIFHVYLKKRRRYRHYRRKLPSAAKFFLSFLDELDISESIETNFFSQKNFLIFALILVIFLKKKIGIVLIRREM